MAKKRETKAYEYDGDLFSDISEETRNKVELEVSNQYKASKEEIVEFFLENIKNQMMISNESFTNLQDQLSNLSNGFSAMLSSKILKSKIKIDERLNAVVGNDFFNKVKNISDSAKLLRNEFADKETKQKASHVLSKQRKDIKEYHSIG